MSLLKLFKRAAQVFVLVTVALLVGLSVYFRIEQHRLRLRAEKLLADVRGLEIGRTSYGDVRRMTGRWDFGASLPQEKGCTDEACDYFLELSTPTERAFEVTRGRLKDATVARILTLLGRRPAAIQVRIGVRGRVMRTELFSVLLSVQGSEGDDEILSGSAGTTPNQSDRERPSVKLSHWLRHPGYLVGEFSGVASADYSPKTAPTIWAEFSKDVSVEDSSRLLQFDLGCLTRVRSCTFSNLMPSVWAQVDEDRRTSYPSITCSAGLAQQVADLADLIAVVRPTTISLRAPAYEGAPYELPALDVIRLIKKPRFWRSEKSVDIQVPDAQPLAASDTRESVRAGQQYIVMGEQYAYRPILYPCGVLTLNDANLATVSEAAADGAE
jgi:hypothetical protein